MKRYCRSTITGGLLLTGFTLFCPALRADIPGTTLVDTIELSTGPNSGAESIQLNRATHKLYTAGGNGALRGPAVKVIDTTAGAVLRTISFYGVYLRQIAIDDSPAPEGNKLYAVVGTYVPPQSTSYALRVVDANTDTALTNASTDIQLPYVADPADLAVNPVTHKVYVLDSGGNVTVVDGISRTVIKTVQSMAGVSSRFIVNPDANKLFLLTNEAGRKSAVIDGGTDTVTNFTIDYTPDATGYDIPCPAVYNPGDGRIYLHAVNSSYQPGLYVLNGVTGAIITIANLPITNGSMMTVDPATNRLFASGSDSAGTGIINVFDTATLLLKASYKQGARAMRFDTANGGQLDLVPPLGESVNTIKILKLSDATVKQIIVAYTPASVAVNSKTNRVYAGNGAAAETIVLDGATHAVIARVPVRSGLLDVTSPTFFHTEERHLAVSEALNRVYLSGFAKNADGSRNSVVDVFDGQSNALLTTIAVGVDASGLDGSFVAVDDTRRHFYFANESAVLVYSIDTNVLLATIPLPEGCNGLSVNPVTGRVYVSGSSFYRKVQILDGNTSRIVAAVDAGEPYQSAVNKKTNKVFIVRATNSVTVLNGATDSVETTFSNTTQNGTGQDNVANVAVDEVTNTVYVLDDANGNGAVGRITAFDGNNNYAFLGQINLGRYPTSIGLNRTTRELFVSNDQDGTISVLKNSTAKPPELFGDISTRVRVGSADNVLIGGFIVTGPEGTRKTVVVRAVGPSLTGFGVAGALADTVLELHDSQGNVIINDDWRKDYPSDTVSPTREALIRATNLAPTDDRESAIVVNLPTGATTAIVHGKADGPSGIALVEAYDIDQGSPAKLANISTRGRVETGDNAMIGGIIVLGSNPSNVVVRAIGPSLAAFGVRNTLADPILELRDQNGAIVAINDDWKKDYPSTTESPERKAAVIATGVPPTDDRESAIVATLFPANYTAIVRGNGTATGVALVEAYSLP